MVLSEFERQRQENIQRNKQLLQQLSLDAISSSIAREASPSTTKTKKTTKPASSKKRKTETRVKKESSAEPTRRSRRLAGIKTESENPEEYARIRDEEEAKERKKREIERLKRTKLFGEFKLMDLVTDKKSGELVNEEKVIGSVSSNGVKKEVEDEDMDNAKRTLELIQSLGDKFSAGDFYEVIRNSEKSANVSLESKRKEFDSLHIYEKHDPLDIKISHSRITAIHMHPSQDNRLILAGDTMGNVGLWAVDSTTNEEEPEPAITILHPHGRNISKIITPTYAPSKIYTASYDGSVRSLDLHKLESTELAYLNDPYESSSNYFLGVSDINQCMEGNPNVIYMTTLEGHFYQYDTREPFVGIKRKDLLRLHDKKIGGFTINPTMSTQIATASLDRSLRIWDLRNIGKSSWSEYEHQKSPHMYGSYSSRLSVSCVDWNRENRLVCNGYDDNICLFDYSGGEDTGLSVITEWGSDYVPHQSRKRKAAGGEEQDLIPDNLKPFNKIRHNCQTGRWVSILKSKWQQDPQDGMQKFVIANMNRGLDIYDQQGNILAHLNEKVGAVPAVATMHPTQNWVVGGSASGKVYFFK
ncbi:uncharacterized protein J8A68_001459 [[Candida] subhashii]|uniref:DNA damage-binding protein CMR1 n=1 Tax=[Candida] subhashii TaxID=561895 RepID=A0A8J5QG36_9ASCO|nr:uncharacterized protein J8A68_001459 [[Candida] subhashii]KAG7664994.1 hypothetical protein J8A68_001459 [[Candida] subhashii]